MEKEFQLEKNVSDFYKSTKISKEELNELVALSGSLKFYEENKEGIPSTTKISEKYGNNLSLDTALEIAEEFGDEKYMEKVIKLKYIPDEIMVKDLEEHGGILSAKMVARIYKKKLLKCFEPYQELRNLEIKHSKDIKYELNYKLSLIKNISKTIIKKSFFKQRKKLIIVKKTLADFLFDGFCHSVSIKLYDPLVLRVCGKTFKKLKGKFAKWRDGYDFIKEEYGF